MSSIKFCIRGIFLLFVAMIISSCGEGSCSTSKIDVPTGTPALGVVAPTAYPSGAAVSVPVVVDNTGDVDLTELEYTIDDDSNTTGADIKVDDTTKSNCKGILAKQSCTVLVKIPAEASPGSFTITASQANHSLNVQSTVVGLVSAPINAESGANGINLFYTPSIMGNPDGLTQVVITAYVSSANAGIFNTIALVDESGNQLNYRVLTGNSGSGLGRLVQGDVVSYLVTIPSGATQLHFKPRTIWDDAVVSTATNSSTIVIGYVNDKASVKIGILSVAPNYFVLKEGRESQVITLSNIGSGDVTNLTTSPQHPLIKAHGGIDTCGSTLAAGAKCYYTVYFDADDPEAGTSSVVFGYNDGVRNQSATATVNYMGVDVKAGLIISSANSNFDYLTRTSTPTQSNVVTLSNVGNVNESNFTFSLPPHFTVNTTGITDSPCLSSTILPPGGRCKVNLVYSNTTATAQTTTTVTVGYVYGEDAKSASSNVSVSYQTIQSEAVLALTPSVLHFANIVNDNSESEVQRLILTNSGDESAVNVAPAPLNSIFHVLNSDCNSDLAPGETCYIDVNFGPVNHSISGAESLPLTVSYKSHSGAATSSSTEAELVGFVADAGSANVVQTLLESAGFDGGTGTSTTPYMIQNNAASLPTITYQFTNRGTVDAESFYIDGAVSSGWTIIDNQCGSSATPITLAASGGACTVKFQLSSTVGSDTNNVAAPTLSLRNLTSHWINQGDTVVRSQALSGSIYVTIYVQAVITITPSMAVLNQGGSTTVTATLHGSYNVTPQTITLSDPTTLAAGITVTPSTCTVNLLSPTCSFVVQASSTMVAGPIYSLTVGHGAITPDEVVIDINTSASATQMLLAPGSDYSCMLQISSGKVFCWGYDAHGELGSGVNVNSAVPSAVVVGGSSAIPANAHLIGLSAGTSNLGGGVACVISDEGKLYCWGDGRNGAIGNGTKVLNNPYAVAVTMGGSSAIPTTAKMVSVTSNNAVSCAIDKTGEAYCWGLNTYGQLGNNSTTDSPYPVKVLKGGTSAIPAGTKLVSISSGGNHVCALDEAGVAYCWGANLTGNLGNGATGGKSVVAVKVSNGVIPAGTKFDQLEVSLDNNPNKATTCGIAASKAYCWGYNGNGAFGNGTTTNSNTPVAVTTGGSSAIPSTGKFTNITTASLQTCALVDGVGYCWGHNERGQLGDGNRVNTVYPVKVTTGGSSAVPAGVKFVNIGTAYDDGITNGMSSCAQANNNKFYCWGDNTYGELGAGTIDKPAYSTLPLQVLIP